MATRKKYDPGQGKVGGFCSNDGTIEFFNRINALLKADFTVLDIGAGRGSWYHLDGCEYRKNLRTIRGKVKEYICADIDEAVLENPTSDRNLVISKNRVPLEDRSVDLIVSDYVLEHVLDVGTFKEEISRLLKPGGYFCARTPHGLHYVSVFARLIRNSRHSKVLRFIQPERNARDVFPTAYKLNTLRRVHDLFPDWQNYSYLHASEPQYFFGSRPGYALFVFLHALLPKPLKGNVFIFLRNSGCRETRNVETVRAAAPAAHERRARITPPLTSDS
jgi:SAM-dependent methyltransferase